MRPLTIAYITARKEPHFAWFADSLARQIRASHDIRLVVIDHHCHERRNILQPYLQNKVRGFRWVTPKPSVWQGAHRLTEVDFFSASNARNTAIALCDTDWIAMVDDLSVLMPGWLDHAIAAMDCPGIVTCGAFQKVQDLKVIDGLVHKFTKYKDGKDWRLSQISQPISYRCPPEWFFGCSFVAPWKALLDVNGYPEALCDGLGYEDSIMGKMLYKAEVRFRFDPGMMTWESEDDHHNQPSMLRIDPGTSPKDKSHAVKQMVDEHIGQPWFDQRFGECRTIEALWNEVDLDASTYWPIPKQPTDEWFTGMPLAEFHRYRSHE